jgi:membrane-associated protease RseP (regulator of RpoE activity)
MFTKLAVRDTLIAAAVIGLWLVAAPLSAGTGPIADLTGALLGIAAFVVAHLAHEWGHLLGARLTRSRVAPPATLTSPFLFSFDSTRNSQRQFVIMSLSGFAVSALSLLVAYALLPDGLLATRVARGLVVFGASLTVFLEVPLLVVSLLSGSIVARVEVFALPASPSAGAASSRVAHG